MAELRAVLLDLGNTLIYFDGNWPDVFARADQALLAELHKTGVSINAEQFLAEFRNRLNAYYEQRESEFIEYTTSYVLQTLLTEWGSPPLPEESLRAALREMYAVSQEYWLPEPEAIPVLETLLGRGLRLGLVSNAADDADVQTLVDKAALRPYFDVILSSAACGIRKPNPRIFRLALEPLGVTPDSAVMVGDTLGADILGAHNAGLRSVWITRRADTPANHDHEDTIEPDAAIATLGELPDLIAAWEREK
ncbi:MAG: HAD family hydrolase [Anaerolineae bacterium]|nr:MAG: HAD family hydrolase [Anaerolineae bacterium]